MIENRQSGQLMPFTGFIVVEIVGRRDFDGACTEFQIDKRGIAHDGNGPLGKR